jgi:Glycosyltransferase family 17.
MYFDEDLVLDIRLNTLNDAVNKFIIAEATIDHAGNKKKLNFDIKKFSKFKNKIDYLVIEDLPKKVENFKKDWESAHLRDQFQRNSLQRGYKESDDEDLIMISDIDEIPDPKKISEFNKKNHYACFMQKNFQSKINMINMSQKYWGGTKICQKKFLKSPQWLRNIKTKKRPFWKFYKPKEPQLIFDGGWHFSYLKKPENISKKIKSFAHQEFNQEKFTNVKNIKEKIKNHSDIFGRNYKYKKIDLNGDFPKYILENKSKFNEWIA